MASVQPIILYDLAGRYQLAIFDNVFPCFYYYLLGAIIASLPGGQHYHHNSSVSSRYGLLRSSHPLGHIFLTSIHESEKLLQTSLLERFLVQYKLQICSHVSACSAS